MKLFKKKKKEKVTPGGSTVYYHENDDNGWIAPETYCVHIEEVEAYFEDRFPESKTSVLHEIISHLVHIDVHVIEPGPKNPFYVLYTTGMSDLPMHTGAASKDDYGYAELVMYLPQTWNMAAAMASDAAEVDYWPVRLMKYLARFPHTYKTWLGWGHTIPNGADYTPWIEGSELSGVALAGYGEVTGKEDIKVNLYYVVGVTKDEMEYKLEHGMEALEKHWEDIDFSIILNPERKSSLE